MNPTLHTWATIAAVVLTATAGDILIAGGMRKLGDLDDIRAKSGLLGAIKAVLSSGMFLLGITCMALSFFSLLFALSGADLSLIAPATASLTFITTAAIYGSIRRQQNSFDGNTRMSPSGFPYGSDCSGTAH